MIIAILGPTAVGKTALSIALAKKYNAEVINFDAMQVYVKLDIGTAKVTKEEINLVLKNNANETLGYTEDPIVSSDVIGETHGGVVDSLLTNVLEKDGTQLVKVVAWYDNEMSYSAQMVRTAKYLFK